MLKKILISGLAALLVTAIGFSVYNVMAQSEARKANDLVQQQELAAPLANSAQTQGLPENQAEAVVPAPSVSGGAASGQRSFAAPDANTQGYAAGQGAGQGQSAQASTGRGQGRRGQGSNGQSQNGQSQNSGAQPGTGIPAPQNGLSEWITLHGVVSSFAPPSLVLNADDGQVVSVEVGNQSFLNNLGVTLSAGDGVTVTGFYDLNGGLTVGTITLDASGLSYTLRDELGRPVWRGGK